MHPAGFPASFAPTVNNLQRLVAAGGKDITSSSPLLVNLLQSDVAAATHFNNLAHQHRLPFPFDAAGPPPKRKRRPRKNKDQAAKVPKLTEGGEDASVPLPGTFPPAGSGSQQQPLENRVPPIGVEAAYNVPNSLGPAGNSTSEPGPSGTPTSGAQVHTPPLADSALASQGGPLSNQVSPNSSGTLSVSTPSPIRTTPERAIAASGSGQQMINPYTGQLEPIDGSPASERGPSKPDTQGDNTGLDVPAQLEPPPNPLVALENRLAASSQNLSLPSQLPSSPRTIDSLANRTLPNSVQATSSAGMLVPTPLSRHPLSNTNMPPISTDSMQSRMTLPVTVVDSPHVKPPGEMTNVRPPGNVPHPRPHGPGETPMSMPRGLHPHHNRPEGPPFRVSTPGAMGPSPMTSSPMSVMGQQQGVDMHGIHRHPHIPQLNHPSSMELRPGVSSAPPGVMSQGMRQQGPAMRLGHPDPRMRMPPPHSQAGMPHHLAADIHHGLPPYPGSIPRSRAPGMPPGGPNPPPMHSFEPNMNPRAPMPGHPPHSKMPRLQQPMPPGYFQHMQQQQRMPVTSTVSSAHMMTSNAPPMHMQGHNPKGSVIADQLMRPTLNDPSSSTSTPLPHQAPPTASHPKHSGPPPPPTVSSAPAGPTAAASSAQMSHPAIASQLSGAAPLQPKTEPTTTVPGSVAQPPVESAQQATPKVEEPSVTDSQTAVVTPKVAESQPAPITESKSEIKKEQSAEPSEPKVEEKTEPSSIGVDAQVTSANPPKAEAKLEAPTKEETKLEVPQESQVVEASQASTQDSGSQSSETVSETTAAAKEKPLPSSESSGENNVVADKPQDSKLLEGQGKSDDSSQSLSNSDIVPASSQLNESVKSDIPQQQSDVEGAKCSEVNQSDSGVKKGVLEESEQNSVEHPKSLPSKVDLPSEETKVESTESECKKEAPVASDTTPVKTVPSPVLGTPAPSGSQSSDSPPTTSPGDSDGTPSTLDNFHDVKLGGVSPPLRATTLSAISMHNDLHSLVRGSNGASTGEASPVSDNLSSTSQQNYGQSPLGNSVGMHMNHDSELSSQSFDDNSSTPPHTQVWSLH